MPCVNGRYIGACEAIWRLLQKPLGTIWPPIERLHLHMPKEQLVKFYEEDSKEQITQRLLLAKDTKLQAWLDNNLEERGLDEIRMEEGKQRSLKVVGPPGYQLLYSHF